MGAAAWALASITAPHECMPGACALYLHSTPCRDARPPVEGRAASRRRAHPTGAAVPRPWAAPPDIVLLPCTAPVHNDSSSRVWVWRNSMQCRQRAIKSDDELCARFEYIHRRAGKIRRQAATILAMRGARVRVFRRSKCYLEACEEARRPIRVRSASYTV